MDSDFQQQQYPHHFHEFPRQFHHQKQQTNNLTRFRSAPSSYFASFLDAAADTVTTTGGASGGGGGGGVGVVGGGGGGGAEKREYTNARPLSPETESIFANFMSSIGAENNSSSQKLCNIQETSAVQPEYTVRVKEETDTQHQQQLQQSNFNTQSRMLYHIPPKPPLSNQHTAAVSSAMQNSFKAVAASSSGINSIPLMRTGGGVGINNNNVSLTRHSSSPAGFFANLNMDTGYGMIGGMGNYGGGNGGNVQVNVSSGQASTSDLINQNSDVAAKSLRMNSLDEKRFSHSSNNHNNDSNYGFSMNSWDDSILSENYSSLDGVEDEDIKIFPELNTSENQSGEGKHRPPPLTHHLSLPKTLPEMSNMEKFLQYQDSVPLRIRAKRGCATHPRSIAERVRRTRISERMRKLQDLVPNMDKQTNTADMLDLAVEYIKDLQKKVENLNDNRAKCTCS